MIEKNSGVFRFNPTMSASVDTLMDTGTRVVVGVKAEVFVVALSIRVGKTHGKIRIIFYLVQQTLGMYNSVR